MFEINIEIHTTSNSHYVHDVESSQCNRNAQEQSRHPADITTLRLLEKLGEHEVRSLLTSHPLHCTLYVAYGEKY